MPGSIDDEYALNCTQYLIILAEGGCIRVPTTCVEEYEKYINHETLGYEKLCLSCHADEALKRMVREKEELEKMIESLGEKGKA